MLIIWHAASLADCNIVPALSYSLVSYIIATCITPELSKHNFWSNMLVMFKPIGGLTGHQGQHKHDTKYRRRYSAMGLLLQFISLVHLNALMNNGLWILRMMRVKHQKCTARLYYVTILMNEKLFIQRILDHVHYYGLLLLNLAFVYLMYINIWNHQKFLLIEFPLK